MAHQGMAHKDQHLTFKAEGRKKLNIKLYPNSSNYIHCCLVTKLCPILHNPWTVICQAPLSMGFPRQEYWSGLPFPSPGYLSNPGIEPNSPALAGGFFTTEPQGKPKLYIQYIQFCVYLNKAALKTKANSYMKIKQYPWNNQFLKII